MKKTKTAELAHISLCTALICVCSWIQVPFAVPFTLQTFAVFFTVMTFGIKKGLTAVVVYTLLGIVGVPVFSGFQGGIGALVGRRAVLFSGLYPQLLLSVSAHINSGWVHSLRQCTAQRLSVFVTRQVSCGTRLCTVQVI